MASPSPRRYLMCAPEYFDVVYEINPWMDAGAGVDRDLALAQWHGLVATYRGLGHVVHELTPRPDLPDMVYAANGATVVGGRVLGAAFATEQRAPEAGHHLDWHTEHAAGLGWSAVATPQHTNEAEGDFAVLADVVLAGYGFRTDPRAHAELAELAGVPAVGLRLVGDRYYHLDVALAVLEDGPVLGVPVGTPGRGNVAWYPPAFSPGSQAVVRRLFPEALVAADVDAEVLGLNLVSDGRHVVVAAQAEKLAAQLAEIGYEPVPVDLSELRRGGGGIKCCTQELRPAR